MEYSLKISDNIQSLRKINGLGFPDLAESTGIDVSSLRTYATSEVHPNLIKVVNLSGFFGVSVDFLLLGNETKYTKSTRFLSLCEKIDKMPSDERFTIEKSILLFLGQDKDKKNKTVVDSKAISLANNAAANIRILRKEADLSQEKLGNMINQSGPLISQYESGKYDPSFENLARFSEIFCISIHAICTGKKLDYDFGNSYLKNIVLLADSLLSTKDKYILCETMQKIISNQPAAVAIA